MPRTSFWTDVILDVYEELATLFEEVVPEIIAAPIGYQALTPHEATGRATAIAQEVLTKYNTSQAADNLGAEQQGQSLMDKQSRTQQVLNDIQSQLPGNISNAATEA